LRESLNQPLMVIFEDLHWIDSETQSLLNLLVDSLGTARILLLVNYRPEYRHEWGNRTYYTQLRLDPLGRESAEEMLTALLGTTPELGAGERPIPPPDQGRGEPALRSASDEWVRWGASGYSRLHKETLTLKAVPHETDLTALKRLIIERTDGNPFFMEESVQVLLDEGALVRNGQVKLTKPLRELKIPPTVQAILTARIDRLPAAEKELLQTLAVIGKEHTLDIIRAVTGKSDEQLEPMLSDLQLGEFIYEQPSLGGAEYTFKHALTQEVAYNSLLAQRRRRLHEQTARAIEGLYPERLEDHYAALAHDYLLSDNAPKAFHYARLAAEQAAARAAYSEASSLIEAALKLLDVLPEDAERMRTELAMRSIESLLAFVLYGASSNQRERAIRRTCELGERLGERDQLVGGRIHLSNLHYTRGEAVGGLEVARQTLELAEGVRDAGLLVDLQFSYGCLAHSCGRFREAVSRLEEAIGNCARADRSTGLWGLLYGSGIRCHAAHSVHLLGRVGDAAKLAAEGLRHARESNHLFSLGHALVVGGGWLLGYRREPEIALMHAEEVIALSEENGFAEWLPWGRFIRGWALFELGQAIEGLTEMEAGIAGCQRLGGVPRLQYLIALRAEAIARAGREEEALTMLNETLVHIEQTGDTADEAEMLRLKGELLLMQDVTATAEAEHCFRAALEVAQAQKAKWWELRTTVSLARLLRDSDRCDEARAMLSEIYNWFSEGFDLPDLKDAKALFQELRATLQ